MKKIIGKDTPGKKRWLALLMSVCLIGTMIPITVRAENGSTTEPAKGQKTFTVAEVEAMIDALPDVEYVKALDPEEDAETLEEIYLQAADAADAFDTLSDEDQKSVSNLNKLMKLHEWFNGGVATMDESVLASGTFEDSEGTDGAFNWILDNEGTLTIKRTETGSGEMPDWFPEHAPWYNDRHYIKAVSIGDGVTSIGNCAFYSCSNLTSIVLPDSLTEIGNSAFQDCSGLVSITIPASVETIGVSAFQDCNGLTAVTFGRNSQLTELGANAFYNCERLTSITIPAGVTMIGAATFTQCYALESITIPANVETIGRSAFQRCSALESITIPASVTTIGGYVFYGCTGLTAVTFEGTTPPNIDPSAFSGCNITTIRVPEGSAESYSEQLNGTGVKINPHTVTVQAGDGGSASASSGTSFGVGETVSLTYTPDKCYTLSGWEVVSGNVTVGSDNTFTMPEADVTVKALFKRSHQLTEHPEVPADYTSEGMRRYWSCSDCGAKFSDAEGTVTVTDAELVIPHLDYQIINGADSSWTAGSSEGLTIRGAGDFSKFTGVKVDGNLLDQNNYTAKEGSTIITLKAAYLNALAAGNHTVEILWTDGSASTTFTINANTSDNGGNNDNGSDNPNTPSNPAFTYDILNGADSSWTAESSEGLTIRGAGDFSKFSGVTVDGSLLDQGNYTAREGSTIITLSTSYLNTLAAGSHSVEIFWTDGSASTAFTIDAAASGEIGSGDEQSNQDEDEDDDESDALDKESNASGDNSGGRLDTVPKTGDSAPIGWLFVLVALSGTGLILTGKKGKRI